MFNKLKNAFAGKVNKYSGKKDFLEAVCAACALVAAADGDLEDAEIAQTIKGIQSNPELAGAFPSREIEQTADQMLKRAQGGRVGRNGLFKELEDIAARAERRELIMEKRKMTINMHNARGRSFVQSRTTRFDVTCNKRQRAPRAKKTAA